MTAVLEKPKPPTADKRWRIVDATMRRNGARRNGLIESLHTVQECFGYVDEASLTYVARALRVPLSAAYGVVTFYHFFTLKPPGRHTCVVCTGTACYIKGARQLLEQVGAACGIRSGETSADGRVSLLQARCVGSCGLAPVVVADGEVLPKVTEDTLERRLEEWRDGES
jgi:bidirectional [NiFe] hydrogenase diaphorase subunit